MPYQTQSKETETMPASPMVRFTFTDGTTYEIRMSQWIWSPGSRPRKFLSVANFAAGQTIQPDYPDGPVRTIATKEVLPYANANNRKQS